MLYEFLKLIQQTAVEAKDARILDMPGDGRTAFIQVDGGVHQYPVPPKPREHRVHSLVDLILYARRAENINPIVWHCNNGVTLLADDEDRRDKITFPLSCSSRYLTLVRLEAEKKAFNQQQFIRLLRIELGLDNVAVVSKFRKLDFLVNQTDRGEVAHGLDRLGKEIAARVQGIDELPEELHISTPIYQQNGEREEYTVRCAVEIDTINKVFYLIPLPDELMRVEDLHQASIHDRLTAALGAVDGQTSIPVFYGKP